jgi:hypothetical protein
MEQPSPPPVIRDLPWLRWCIGLVLGGFALFTAIFAFMPVAALFGFGSLLLFSLPSVLTIRADGARGVLTLTYRSLLRKTVKEFPFQRIASIDIEVFSGQSPSYRVVITQRDGQVTPLRYYSPGNKKDLARRLRELTGVGGSTVFASHRPYEALIAPYAQLRETSGVRWNVGSIDMGGVPVTRWFSPDYKTKATFVYLAQKPASQKSVKGMIGRTAMHASMARYGFTAEDVPGSEEGEMVVLDHRLNRDFMAFSPDPSAAGRILNRRVVEVLEDRAEYHPLRMIQVVGKSLGQLVVLYSPDGVYAATIKVGDSSQLEELVDTGVRLVKAQDRSAS